MNKIQTNEDVLKWAEDMVAANGELFTPLSKGEQFLIAKFILNNQVRESDCTKEENANPVPPLSEVPNNDEHTRSSFNRTAAESTEEAEMPKEKTAIKMTRGAAYHLAGHSAQKAYDEFLSWCKEHPQEGSVMDFFNGQTSVAAAYAYWLHEILDVQIK